MKESKEKHDFLRAQPDIADVFHYSFCYIGALAGKKCIILFDQKLLKLCFFLQFLLLEQKTHDIYLFLLISGPYYRYRTYYDFINLPYWKYADCQKQTNKRIILAPMAALAFYLMSQVFPHSVRI
jgi:hypothetical protein